MIPKPGCSGSTLLAYNPTPRSTPRENRPYILPGMIEDLPIFRVTVVADRPVQAVEALNPNTELRKEGNTVQATIERDSRSPSPPPLLRWWDRCLTPSRAARS